MKLIVGLGNPGRRYAKHRHNIGFWVVDQIAALNDISVNTRTFGAKIGKGKFVNKSVILAKPQKFMNLSGIVVAPLLGYYKCSLEDLIVIHDDIDLEVSRMKLTKGSGHGGHNGVKSIIDELGSPDFYRVRVGVGRPPQGVDPADYVLHPFSKGELADIEKVIKETTEAIEILIKKGLTEAQQKYH